MSEQGNRLPSLYEMDEYNGWSIGMRAISHALLRGVTLPPGPLLELGCGSGVFNRQLCEAYPGRAVFGADLHPLALAYACSNAAQPGILLRANLLHLPFPAATFAAIIALDTFDQQGVDLSTALMESWRLLQPGGWLLLRVSAHAWLQGAHDTAFNTGRRFSHQELVSALQVTNFAVQRITYANTLLAPPVVALRLLQRWGWLIADEDMQMGVLTSRLFAEILGYEAQWLAQGDLPFGISLYAVAEKRAM